MGGPALAVAHSCQQNNLSSTEKREGDREQGGRERLTKISIAHHKSESDWNENQYLPGEIIDVASE